MNVVDTLLGLIYSIFFISSALFMDFSDKVRLTRKSCVCFRIGIVALIFHYINNFLSVENYYIFWTLFGIALITVIVQYAFKNKTIKEVN
jgi:hypothetical protein